jgi:lysophospholipase L1-like esterase
VRLFSPESALVEPAHDVLFLEPERVVGWIHHPGFRFLWTGRYPYCIEFRVHVSINRDGFRDDEWTAVKPPDSVRIALLGDSHVEALQVPLGQTAGKVLERRLSDDLSAGQPVQVMNFGVANYSVAQFLLVYNQYVRRFKPDYVFIYVAYLHMARSLYPNTSFSSLRINPTYRLSETGDLIYVPAEDYDAYVKVMDTSLQERFGADRSVEIFADSVSPSYLVNWLKRRAYIATPPSTNTGSDVGLDFPGLSLNYRLIEALNQQIKADGGRLIFVDTFDYFERYGPPGTGALAARNQQFARTIGAGYINLSQHFRASTQPVQWPCDGHLTPDGNQLFAEAMYAWLAKYVRFRS